MRRILLLMSFALLLRPAMIFADDQADGGVDDTEIIEQEAANECFKRWLPGIVSFGLLVLSVPGIKAWTMAVVKEITTSCEKTWGRCEYERALTSEDPRRCAICGPERTFAFLKLLAPVKSLNGRDEDDIVKIAKHDTLWFNLYEGTLKGESVSLMLVILYGINSLVRTAVATGSDIAHMLRKDKLVEAEPEGVPA